jgi:peptide/nickel transport system permease protein
MWAYIARRLLYAVPILLGVSMLVFALIHLAPGDVVDLLVPPEVPKEIADSLRARFALDQPIYIQYLAWLGRLLVGDLGVSFFTNRPVSDELFSALANTLMLALPAAVLGFSLGVLLGALAAFNRGTWLDKAFFGDGDHRGQPAALLGRHRPRCDFCGDPQRVAGAGHGRGRVPD